MRDEEYHGSDETTDDLEVQETSTAWRKETGANASECRGSPPVLGRVKRGAQIRTKPETSDNGTEDEGKTGTIPNR